MIRKDLEIARQAMFSRRVGISEQESRRQREVWENMTQEDKRVLYFGGLVAWLLWVGVVFLEAWESGCF